MEPKDVSVYTFYQKIARAIRNGHTIEFWKSTPYLLNFMEGYEFKRLFGKARDNLALSQTLREEMRSL
jgi:hypothetical protein